MIKVYIYAAGIEQFIYRSCLRRDAMFMGFLLPVSPVRTDADESWICLEEAVKNADENTFFLVSGETALFESYGVRKERILLFYSKSNLRRGKAFFCVLDKKKWLKECIVRYVWTYASDKIKGYFMKKYIERDVRLWHRCRNGRKGRVVFLGVNVWTDYYVKRLGGVCGSFRLIKRKSPHPCYHMSDSMLI